VSSRAIAIVALPATLAGWVGVVRQNPGVLI